MSQGTAIRRQEAVLIAAVVSVVLALLVITLDAARFHVAPMLTGGHSRLDTHTLMLVVLLAIEAPVLWGCARACQRQARLRKQLGALVPIDQVAFDGIVVDVVPGPRAMAFCAGLLRPRICITDAALDELDADQLRAVLAHELGHARRRDPLRVAVADVVAGGFWFIAPLRRLALRQASVADLAADAAALRDAGGSPRALASALLALDHADPQRVEHLLGRPLRVAPGLLLAAAGLAAGTLAAAALGLTLTPVDPALPGILVPLLVTPAIAALWVSSQRPDAR